MTSARTNLWPVVVGLQPLPATEPRRIDSDAGVRWGIRSAVVMRLRIDADVCTGHGRCYALAPEVFEPDEDGHGLVLHEGEVPAGLEEVARRAANNCPERAITVEE
jgi:ferredoxin